MFFIRGVRRQVFEAAAPQKTCCNANTEAPPRIRGRSRQINALCRRWMGMCLVQAALLTRRTAQLAHLAQVLLVAAEEEGQRR